MQYYFSFPLDATSANKIDDARQKNAEVRAPLSM
jgi:hypothetical protein